MSCCGLRGSPPGKWEKQPTSSVAAPEKLYIRRILAKDLA